MRLDTGNDWVFCRPIATFPQRKHHTVFYTTYKNRDIPTTTTT